MRKFTLKRLTCESKGTLGLWYDGNFVLYTTLEPIVPIIPIGSYTCKKRWSNKFKREVFEVINVPNHTDVEIHIGNYIKDTLGCILLGFGLNLFPEFSVTNSGKAFLDFMNKLSGVNTFKLEIK